MNTLHVIPYVILTLVAVTFAYRRWRVGFVHIDTIEIHDIVRNFSSTYVLLREISLPGNYYINEVSLRVGKKHLDDLKVKFRAKIKCTKRLFGINVRLIELV